MKNPEMLIFVPDYRKNKNICENAVTQLPDLLRYITNQ